MGAAVGMWLPAARNSLSSTAWLPRMPPAVEIPARGQVREGILVKWPIGVCWDAALPRPRRRSLLSVLLPACRRHRACAYTHTHTLYILRTYIHTYMRNSQLWSLPGVWTSGAGGQRATRTRWYRSRERVCVAVVLTGRRQVCECHNLAGLAGPAGPRSRLVSMGRRLCA